MNDPGFSERQAAPALMQSWLSADMMTEAVLAVHVAVILFNVFGLVAVPIGALCNWSFVHVGWWRLLHVLSLAAVVVQAVLGQACFLTVWQNELSAADQPATPLIVRWVNEVVYWQLPIWVFAALYLLVFAYALALLWFVPTRRPRSRAR